MPNSEYITIWIGSKIKDVRKSKELKLADLAQMSGISIAMLSKIENGRVFPTLPSLLQIFEVLDIELYSFFNDLYITNKFPGYIFKKRKDLKLLEKEEGAIGFQYELILSHTIERSSVEISLLTLKQDNHREKLSTEGFEYIYLIKGEIEYRLGQNTFYMEEGDSLFFDGRIDHVPINRGEEAVLLVLYFITLN
ncbi:XRE family transcriptional regulator [Membranihabitans marinus]